MLYVSDITFTVDAIMYELENGNSTISIRCGSTYYGTDQSYVGWETKFNNGIMSYMYYPGAREGVDFAIAVYSSDGTKGLMACYDTDGNLTSAEYSKD